MEKYSLDENRNNQMNDLESVIIHNYFGRKLVQHL
jgi:hypothetical protein